MILYGKINNTINQIISRSPLSIEEMGRRKLLITFLLMNIPADVIFGIYDLVHGLFDLAILNFLLAFVMTCFIILLRYLKNGSPVYRFVALIYSLTLFYWIITGTGQGNAVIWALLHPLFSFYLLGKKEGLAWSVIFTAAMVLIIVNPHSMLHVYKYSSHFTSRFLPAFFMIFLFTYSYESVRKKYKSAMESEQTELLLEKEKLAGARDEAERVNRQLKNEVRMKIDAEVELRRHHDHLEDIVAERTLELKKNIEELEASEKRYRLMADNVNDLIWSADLNLNFSFISPSVYRIYGYTVEEAMKLTFKDCHTPESYVKMLKIYHDEIEPEKKSAPRLQKHIIIQLDQIKKDGTVFTVESKISSIQDEEGNAVGLVGITRDISDRIAIEQEKEKIKEQLAQSQKMEALGTLVSGLAHDFNNFLTGIVGSFDLISMAIKKEELINRKYIEKYLHLGMESSKRSAALIDQLLILSKKHEIKLSPLDIKISISHIHELCRNSFPKSIELKFRTGESPLTIMGDMIQIEQVLLNLCINASHAMTIMRKPEDKQGGTLTVTAEKVNSDYIMKENYPESAVNVDYWIRIKISDTGVGIDPDTKQKIFEPFFSTKNESTGLGLAISYNIIKKHGGLVNVYSVPGQGSCFSLYFPVYSDKEDTCFNESIQEIVKGTGTVLVIDDEPGILNVAEGFLEQCGYNVITAGGAAEGIEIFRKEHPRISAVLIDLSMPGKSGLDVFRELQEINANVKAILSSGMLDNETKELALKAGVKETVNKPYLAAELSLVVNNVIKGDYTEAAL